MQIGFVGLGVMGGPMAGHLWRKLNSDEPEPLTGLTVWNRSEVRRAPLREMGVPIADSLQDLAEASDAILLCVNRTEDVEECVAEIVPVVRPGTLIVDHSTILPEAASEIHARLHAHGHRFVDAPITGGSMGAQKGTLTIFCGGDEADVAAATPILAAYGKTVERVGPPGAGQMMKMANQIAVAGSLLALCESMAFAKRAGLDLAQMRRLVGSGAAGSWCFENYGPKVLERDWSPGFSIDNQLKDLHYCDQSAEALDAAIPGAKLVMTWLERMQEAGRGGETTAALFDELLAAGAQA